MYDSSVPVFTSFLDALSAILRKAEAYCAARKIDPDALLGARLYPDMFGLARQVQLASDFAKGASARLAGVEVPSYADTEKTFEELQARIAKTKAFIGSLDKAKFADAAGRTVTIRAGGRELSFPGADYLRGFALPNFYFHLATAYNILRHNGLDIGKRDFLGGA